MGMLYTQFAMKTTTIVWVEDLYATLQRVHILHHALQCACSGSCGLVPVTCCVGVRVQTTAVTW